MTKSEIMKYAHAEARKIVAKKHCSYREAIMFGLRRAYNKIENDKWMAMPKAETPKFMWLRGM